MSVAVLVMTDGRPDYLGPAMATLDRLTGGPIVEWWMHDDTGDTFTRAELSMAYPRFIQIGAGPRRGFGGAIAHAWAHLQRHSAARFVFHFEQDFTLRDSVDLDRMSALLDADPTLVQVALRRQAWSAAEIAAGGVIEQHPDDYHDERWGTTAFITHRRYFTTNPSLYRRTLCRVGWPTRPQSEGLFTLSLLEHGSPEVPGDRVRFALWGARTDPPAVEHIGTHRIGTGY